MKWRVTFLYQHGKRAGGNQFTGCEFELVGGDFRQLIFYRDNKTVAALSYPEIRRSDSDCLEFTGCELGDDERWYMQRVHLVPEVP
jgi:hypothetical protein